MNKAIPMTISVRLKSRIGLQTWLSLPANEAQLRAALAGIYCYGDDFFVAGYASTVPGLSADALAGASLSLVNYLTVRLDKLDDWQLAKLAALMESDMRPQSAGELTGYIRDDGGYLFLPDVHTAEELGRYYLYESGCADMPKRWKDAINPVVFGINAADLEDGVFTSHGYIARVCDRKRKKAVDAEDVPARYRLPEPVGDMALEETEGAQL